MHLSAPLFPLFVFIVLFGEFALKSLFETWSDRPNPSSGHQLRIYGWYRLAVFVTHALMLSLIFRPAFIQVLISALVLTVFGCTELLTAGVSNWVYVRMQRTLKPLHLLYTALVAVGIALIWGRNSWQPGPLLSFIEQTDVGPSVGAGFLASNGHVWLLVFFLASIPANYVIRWLLNKPEDATFPDIVMGNTLTALFTSAGQDEQATPAATAEPSVGPTLRGGRIIGVLERWIVITLLTRGEIAAIGFVFTAKSVVRYHDFSKADFAEYYLIGTLYSVIVALVLNGFL